MPDSSVGLTELATALLRGGASRSPKDSPRLKEKSKYDFVPAYKLLLSFTLLSNEKDTACNYLQRLSGTGLGG